MGVAAQLLSVANVAPLFDAGQDETLSPSAARVFTRMIDFADPGEDTWSGTVNSGDGSQVQELVIDAANRQFTLNHVYSTHGTYSVSVVLSDDDSGSQADTFNAMVNSANSAPTALVLSPSSIDEKVAAGATIGSLTTTDPDASDTFTYSLVSGIGSTDNSSFSIAGDQLKIGASPNFEAKSSYDIRVRSTDQGDLFTEQTFVVVVVPATSNTPPLITQLQSSHPAVCNSSSNGAVTISGAFTDADISDPHLATVNWGDGSAVETVSVNQSADTFTASHAYAHGGIFTIAVTVSDGRGGSSVQTTTAVVEGVGLVQGTLYVVGTDQDDVIRAQMNEQGAVTVRTRLPAGGERVHGAYDASQVSMIAVFWLWRK